LHFEYPLLHEYPHIPAAHVGVACVACVPHMVPHDPQLLRSFIVSAHVPPPQAIIPAAHPETHEYMLPDPEQSGVPAPHAAPQAPQLLAVLTCVSHPWSGPPSPQCA
jgi:hypothetical protein